MTAIGNDTNTMAHTPGPWTIEEYGDRDAPNLVIHKESETRVCFMATPGSHGDPARIEADARLIATAPELVAPFDAADNGDWRALDLLLGHSAHGQFWRDVFEKFRPALAKATGATR